MSAEGLDRTLCKKIQVDSVFSEKIQRNVISPEKGGKCLRSVHFDVAVEDLKQGMQHHGNTEVTNTALLQPLGDSIQAEEIFGSIAFCKQPNLAFTNQNNRGLGHPVVVTCHAVGVRPSIKQGHKIVGF